MSFRVSNTIDPPQIITVRKINATESLTVDTINATTINATTVNVTDPLSGDSINTVIGYVPSTFSTTPPNTAYTLLSSPNKPVATSINDPNILKIPGNAILRKMIISDNRVAITPGAANFRFYYNSTTINVGAGGLLANNHPGSNIAVSKIYGGEEAGSYFSTTSTSDVLWLSLASTADDLHFFNLYRSADGQATMTTGDYVMELTYSVPSS